MTSVLIVEDEPELGQLLSEELHGAGFATQWSSEGWHALTLVEKQPPDLVILDWMLPGLDGLQVLRRLRSLTMGDMPVLMMSARAQDVDRIQGLEQGADDYLTKPFSVDELVARVRAVLRRAGHAAGRQNGAHPPGITRLSHGELVLEPDTHLATLHGEGLQLTRMEFELLSFLMRNPGRTFRRTDLQAKLWQEHSVPRDRTVDNVILRLRRKLGLYGSDLETVWGVGYRLRKLPPCLSINTV